MASFGQGPGPAPTPTSEPPEDAALKQRIETLAAYAAKNGPAFVQTIVERQGVNPEFSFLTGGPGAGYYAYMMQQTLGGGPKPPAQAAAAAAAPPPQQQHPQQQPAAPPPPQQAPDPALVALPVEVSSGWNQVLGLLTGSRDSIRNSQQWFMACAPYASGMAEMMLQQVLHLADYQKQLHVVYLANDILFKALSQRPEGAGPEADGIAQAFKPRLGRMLRHAYVTGGQAMEAQQNLLRVMNFWAERGVFDHLTVEQLTMDLMGISVGTVGNGAAGNGSAGAAGNGTAGTASTGAAAANSGGQAAGPSAGAAPTAAAGAATEAQAGQQAAGGAPAGVGAEQQQAPQQQPAHQTRWGQQPADAAAGGQQAPQQQHSRWGQQPAGGQQHSSRWGQQPADVAAAAAAAAAQPPAVQAQQQQQWGQQPALDAAGGQPPPPQQQWAQQQGMQPHFAAGSAYPAPPPADSYYSQPPGTVPPQQGYAQPNSLSNFAPAHGPGGAAALGYAPPPYPGQPGMPPPGQQHAYPPPPQQQAYGAQHQYPGQPPAGYFPPPGAPPGAYPPPSGAGPDVGYYPPPPAPEPEPEPEGFDPMSFPPGLIPKLVEEKLKTDPPYSPLSILDIERTGVPPPPKMDAYLKARVDKMYAQLTNYRPGQLYSDIESDAPRRGKHFSDREKGGPPGGGVPLPPPMPDLPHAGLGLGMNPGAAMGFGPGGMPVDDGTFTGTSHTGGRSGGGLGWANARQEQRRQQQASEADAAAAVAAQAATAAPAGPGGPAGVIPPVPGAVPVVGADSEAGSVFSSYRYMRSKGYHQMILENAAKKFGR